MRGEEIQSEHVAMVVNELINYIKKSALTSAFPYWDKIKDNPAYFLYKVEDSYGREVSPLFVAQQVDDKKQLGEIYQLVMTFYVDRLHYFVAGNEVTIHIRNVINNELDQLMMDRVSQTRKLHEWSLLDWAMACRQGDDVIEALKLQSVSKVRYSHLLIVSARTHYLSYLEQLLQDPKREWQTLENDEDRLNIFKQAIEKRFDDVCKLILNTVVTQENSRQYLWAAESLRYAYGVDFIKQKFNVPTAASHASSLRSPRFNQLPMVNFLNIPLLGSDEDDELALALALSMSNMNSATQESSEPKVKAPYDEIPVSGSGDCGYVSMFTTRAAALALINENLKDDAPNQMRVINFLEPAVREVLMTDKFMHYLIQQNVISIQDDLYQKYDVCSKLTGSEQTKATNAFLIAYATDPRVARGYVMYDVRDKIVDGGWAHPCVLQSLAFLQHVFLCIWEKNAGNDLIPHRLFPEYQPGEMNDSTRVVDIVFTKHKDYKIHPNHFNTIVFNDKTLKDKLRSKVAVVSSDESSAATTSTYTSTVPLFNSQQQQQQSTVVDPTTTTTMVSDPDNSNSF